MHGKYENRSEMSLRLNMLMRIKEKTVIAGFHSDTTESEVTATLERYGMNEVGMDFGSARIECPAKPITHAFIHFVNHGERNDIYQVSELVEEKN